MRRSGTCHVKAPLRIALAWEDGALRMAGVAVTRDWEVLRVIARLADGPPVGLASSDPKFFERWLAAVTDFHLNGWSQMTPQRVGEVVARHRIQIG